MLVSIADLTTLALGLPYLGLAAFSAYQFAQKREQSRFHRLLIFAAFSLFLLLRVAGITALHNGVEAAALLMLRLSLLSLLVAIYALLLFASDLSNTNTWLDWSAGGILLLLSSAVLLAPAALDSSQQIGFRLYYPFIAALVWLILLIGSVLTICQFCRVSFRVSGVIRQRLHCISGGVALSVVSLALIPIASLEPATVMPAPLIEQALLLLSGLALLAGFAPPGWLRRLWMLRKVEGISTLAGDMILAAPQPDSSTDEQRQTRGLRLMLQRAVNDLSADAGMVQLWNPTQGQLECVVLLLAREQISPPGSKLVDETLLAEAFNRQQALFHQSATRRLYLLSRRAQGRTMLAAPLVAQGQALGVVGISCGPRLLFAEDQLTLLERFANQMAQWLIYQQHAQSTALLESLRAEQAQKERYIAMIAHELRTPLTVMKGRLQLLRRQLNKEGLTTAAEAVTKLDEPYNRLGQLISTFIDVSYLDTGQLQLSQHVLDLSGLVRKVVEQPGPASLVTLELAEQGEEVVGSAQPALVLGDSARLERVLESLLDNARKYSLEGCKILVRLERRAEAGEVVVSVRDFGIGIPSEDQPRIFQRWFRAGGSSASTGGGVGLSLYLGAQIIGLHGGRMWVRSSGVSGEGSTFFFSLPVIAPHEVGSLSDQLQGQEWNQETDQR
ncbi:MAG TPA: HAMP domain-containing sensor histidine kinase [Ktedonobacterales bacterium]|nr:HAMP domain-containing sensor histidine kinase [Ktedonobacterales bacterium]